MSPCAAIWGTMGIVLAGAASIFLMYGLWLKLKDLNLNFPKLQILVPIPAAILLGLWIYNVSNAEMKPCSAKVETTTDTRMG